MSDAAMSTALDRGVSHTPGVQGGSACVDGTRIPVWIIVHWSRCGLSVAEIAQDYPGLSQADIQAALEYARLHPEEIERDLAKQDEDLCADAP